MLDIGALHAGNFAPFADRGCECFGVEVNEEMVAFAREAAATQGIDASISIGTNRALPFDSADIDILVSVNTIHYEDDAADLSLALAEYRRVLRPGGRAFILTAAPEHFIRKSAERLGANQYRLTYDDFRSGQIMSYFEDQEQLASMCQLHFKTVVTGRVTEWHPAASLDFFYALGEADLMP
jgi:SAM-dependent methyltransferase